jgi:hypothetical protein
MNEPHGASNMANDAVNIANDAIHVLPKAANEPVTSVDGPVIPAPAQPVSMASAADLDRKFVAETVATFGPTIRRLASGQPELNHAAMSLILARRLSLVYDTSAHNFLQQRPDQTYGPVTMEHVTDQVTEVLQQTAACHPEVFPMEALRPAQIRMLVDAMKVASVRTGPDAQVVLLRFARECLCLKAGGSLSVEEIHMAYNEFGQKQSLPVYPRSVFHRELARVILKVFSKTPSNSCLRPVKGTAKRTNRRGYKGMAFTGVLVTSRDSEDSRYGGDEVNTSEVLINPS